MNKVVRTKIRTIYALNKVSTEILRLRASIQAEEKYFSEEIEELKKLQEKRIDSKVKILTRLENNVAEFCEYRWDEITTSEAPDTAFLRSATMKKHLNPPGVGKLTAAQKRKFVAKLKTIYGGRKFIRIKEELDVKALIENPRMANKLGLKITQERRLEIKQPVSQVSPKRIVKN